MQLRGVNPTASLTRTFTLPRPDGSEWVFQLRPLPLGFQRRLRERGLTPPAPPIRIARDSQGRPLRDEQGLAVTQSDLTAPEYLAQLELYHQRIAVLAVVESLEADPQVSFEAVAPAGHTGWPAYADALHQELEAAGFTAGDLLLLCQEVCRLSNLLGEHLQQVRANFSSAPPADTT